MQKMHYCRILIWRWCLPRRTATWSHRSCWHWSWICVWRLSSSFLDMETRGRLWNFCSSSIFLLTVQPLPSSSFSTIHATSNIVRLQPSDWRIWMWNYTGGGSGHAGGGNGNSSTGTCTQQHVAPETVQSTICTCATTCVRGKLLWHWLWYPIRVHCQRKSSQYLHLQARINLSPPPPISRQPQWRWRPRHQCRERILAATRGVTAPTLTSLNRFGGNFKQF